MTVAEAFDTNRNCTRFLPFMRGRGFRTAIRYYTAQASSKRLTRKEAEAVTAAGFTLAAVYQDRAREAESFSEAIGRAAGRRAHEYALGTIGQPAGSAIYFSVDFDASAQELSTNIVPFFEGLRAAMDEAAAGTAAYRIGTYGSGLTLRTLLDKGLIELAWLSMSMGFRESKKFRDSGKWNILQHLEEKNVPTPAGAFSYDPDEIAAGGCGDFVVEVDELPGVGGGSRFIVIARDGLVLRAGPGTEFPKIGLLPADTELAVVQRSGDWASVDLQGDGRADGFCHAGFLRQA